MIAFVQLRVRRGELIDWSPGTPLEMVTPSGRFWDPDARLWAGP